MPDLQTLHLMLVCIWLGLVLAETVIEFQGGSDQNLRSAARLHYYIDLFLEIPVVAGVLGTGVALVLTRGSVSSLLALKIALGLAAISVNVYCMALVRLRHKQTDIGGVRRLRQRILQTWVGIPFGLATLYLGLWYFH